MVATATATATPNATATAPDPNAPERIGIGDEAGRIVAGYFIVSVARKGTRAGMVTLRGIGAKHTGTGPARTPTVGIVGGSAAGSVNLTQAESSAMLAALDYGTAGSPAWSAFIARVTGAMRTRRGCVLTLPAVTEPVTARTRKGSAPTVDDATVTANLTAMLAAPVVAPVVAS